MKKKFKQTLQRPIVISLLCLVMVVALAIALTSLQGIKETKDQRSSKLPKDIRNGTQVATVTIKDPNAVSSGTQEISVLSVPSGTPTPTEGDVALAGDRVKFKINSFKKLAVQPLKFQIFDEQAKELTPEYLKSIQGEKVHFFLVHANLREFQHLLPSYSNGTWNISANMPTPGTYYAFVSFSPVRGKPTTLRSDLIVQSASPADLKLPDPTTGLNVTENPYNTALSIQRSENGRIFSFKLMQGAVAASVQPVFETLGQLTLFKHQSPATFATLTADSFSNEAQGLISFASAPLSTGRYTAFVEFRLAGKIYIFPFTFDIGA